MLRKQPAERPNGTEVLAFINGQLGFTQGASMPHAIVKRPSGAIVPMLPEQETLSRATGQGDAQPTTGSGRKRVTRLALAFTAAIGALIAAVVIGRSVVGKSGTAQGTAERVRLHIDSTPTNAEVLRKSDMQPLGRTPFLREQPAGSGQEELILRLPGYADRPLTVDRAASREVQLLLSPLPEPSKPVPAAAPPPVEEKGGKPGKLGGKPGKRRLPGKTKNADIELLK